MPSVDSILQTGSATCHLFLFFDLQEAQSMQLYICNPCTYLSRCTCGASAASPLQTGSATGHWFLFFALQSPVMLAELLACHLLQTKAGLPALPRQLRICLTQATFLAMGYAFWFPPIVQSGLLERIMGEVDGVLLFLTGGLGGALSAAVQGVSALF